ncbi:hypothetical protein T4D_5443 [Trichinella pseudospiralis]|uniref:Uncharacterized protein n=1 Tax=Trichinella pseudospiralis TaxID=6337 RepID=A0A0V1G1N3_TRIPS|nr:hypothetical protein T4D_5443 [Trichinella pseudospiralis]
MKASKTIIFRTFGKTLFHTICKKLEITNGFGNMLPYCLFHEILHKSPMELNMTSMVVNGKEIKHVS